MHSIGNRVNNGDVTSHEYAYDRLLRRIQARLQDGSSWRFGNNDRDEVVSGKGHWTGTEPVAGQQSDGYDGWKLIAELDPAHEVQRAHTWRLDMSGSEEGEVAW